MNSARHIMCEAYRAKMTQKQGYVWFLPGWFDEKWYDVDRLRRDKLDSNTQLNTTARYGSNKENIKMFDTAKAGDLPTCSTSEMLLALNGHFSLIHSNFAPDKNNIEGNKTVFQWKQEVKKKLGKTMQEYNKVKGNIKKNTELRNDSPETIIALKKEIKLNKYSGYVYDAVWLYAYALDTLVSNYSNKSYIQNMHSDRTVREFVKIIKNTSFEGVTGKINFDGQPSRLSNARVLQWVKNDLNELLEHEIGVYVPDYRTSERKDKNHTEGNLIWKESLIWQTVDGKKPQDNPKQCGILSKLANKMDIECQLAITVVFIIGFASLLIIIFILFLFYKRRLE